MSPPALSLAATRLMSPVSGPVPVALMLRLRPASMAELTGVLVLVRLSKLLLLLPMDALSVQPPQPLPVSGSGALRMASLKLL